VKLTGKAITARPHEPNLSAYEAFLRGRHLYYKGGPEAFARAEEYCKQAIALDSEWADPHSYLGRQYLALGFYGLRPTSETIALARTEARKALELLPSEAMAHAVLGGVAGLHDYDWKEAEEQFRLARSPESFPPDVRAGYASFYLVPLGRFEEAIQEGSKAIAQDPLNSFWRARQSATLLWAEMYEPAIVEARKAMELEDGNRGAQLIIALSYFFQGKLAEARHSAEEAFRVAPWNPLAVGLLAGLLATVGDNERAGKLLELCGTMPSGKIVYYLVCSEIDAAIDWYERDIELHEPGAAYLASAGFLKPLRASPRWPKLAKMMNLPAP
jgi:tetratricopeptide (TPR) repeat protein